MIPGAGAPQPSNADSCRPEDAPWIVRATARALGVSGLAGSFMLAYAVLAYFSNMHFPPQNDHYFLLEYPHLPALAVYFIFTLVVGVVVFHGIKPFRLRNWNAARILVALPCAIVLFSILIVADVPFVRGLLAVAPIAGIALAIDSLAGWPGRPLDGGGRARLRVLAWLQVAWCLALVAVLELGISFNRYAAAAFMFPSLIVMGGLLAVEGCWVGGASPAGPNPEGPAEPAIPDLAGHPDGHSRQIPRWMLLSALAAVAIALFPGMVIFDSPSLLEISEASGDGHGLLNVTIVNRGGHAAGPVELWGDGVLIKTIAQIDAFGIWRGEGLRAGRPNKLSVVSGGEEMSSSYVQYPSSCDLIWLVLAITAAGTVMPALLRPKRT